jgi:hypothetical protein
MAKFEYQELVRPAIYEIGKNKIKELEKKNIKYESGSQGEFTIGLNVLGKDGWELIQVNMFNPSKIPNPPLQSMKKNDYNVEIFYFKREIK